MGLFLDDFVTNLDLFCSKHPLGKLAIQRGKLPADYLNVREVERIVLLVAFFCKRLSVSGTRAYGGHSVASTDRSFPGCCVSLAAVSPVTDDRAGVGCVPGNLSSTRWGERPRRCPARAGGRAGLQGTVCHGEQRRTRLGTSPTLRRVLVVVLCHCGAML